MVSGWMGGGGGKGSTARRPPVDPGRGHGSPLITITYTHRQQHRTSHIDSHIDSHNSVQNISRLGAGARLRKDFEMRLRKFMVGPCVHPSVPSFVCIAMRRAAADVPAGPCVFCVPFFFSAWPGRTAVRRAAAEGDGSLTFPGRLVDGLTAHHPNPYPHYSLHSSSAARPWPGPCTWTSATRRLRTCTGSSRPWPRRADSRGCVVCLLWLSVHEWLCDCFFLGRGREGRAFYVGVRVHYDRPMHTYMS